MEIDDFKNIPSAAITRDAIMPNVQKEIKDNTRELLDKIAKNLWGIKQNELVMSVDKKVDKEFITKVLTYKGYTVCITDCAISIKF